MNRHEGVSCDACVKENFNGKRYKCLICYDYDLCSSCYDARASNSRHNASHPMQCILTRADYELYYGGEAFTNIDHLQSYTCPFCSRFGFSQLTLQEHINGEHADVTYEVICPVCAAMPGGDPNLMTDDFAGHLSLVHRSDTRDLIYFLDEPVASPHNVRRNFHMTHFSGRSGQPRTRRSNMHFSVFSSRGITSITPAPREPADPISELLSQLSVRRTSSNTNSNAPPSQLQQLQMHLQLERQQVERNPRRPMQVPNSARESSNISIVGQQSTLPNSSFPGFGGQPSGVAKPKVVMKTQSKFLLNKLLEELSTPTCSEGSQLDRVQFVKQLMVSSMLGNSEKTKPQKSPNKIVFPYYKRTKKEPHFGNNDEIDNKSETSKD